MARSLVSIRALRLEKGLPIDRALDPNGTGIVGEEFTPLTTSLGDVEAKRTSANPAFAGVVAEYFERAGLEPRRRRRDRRQRVVPGAACSRRCARRARSSSSRS